MKGLLSKNPYNMSSIFGEPSEDHVSIKFFFFWFLYIGDLQKVNFLQYTCKSYFVYTGPLEGFLPLENLIQPIENFKEFSWLEKTLGIFSIYSKSEGLLSIETCGKKRRMQQIFYLQATCKKAFYQQGSAEDIIPMNLFLQKTQKGHSTKDRQQLFCLLRVSICRSFFYSNILQIHSSTIGLQKTSSLQIIFRRSSTNKIPEEDIVF